MLVLIKDLCPYFLDFLFDRGVLGEEGLEGCLTEGVRD